VNRDASGNLSSFGWGTNVGWINFNPTHSQVTIHPTTGSFDGYAWGENIGWIHFKNAAPAYNVVTTFTRKTLTVNKAGTGDGTVTSNPAGINCGADCAEAYDQDTVVTLTANADGDSDFAGWSGDCSGTNSTTTVTMDVDKTCTATFNLETIARIGGFFFHDDNGNGTLDLPCQGTDVDPATCEPGLEEATAETTLPSGELYQYDTNTSGWYSFNLLDPGTYHVDAAPPADSWWTPTTAEECDATVVNNWDQVFCHFGYWWGLDGPPMQAAGVAGNQVTLLPTQDATIGEWAAGNQGMDAHLRVRQPGVTSALLQFDLSGLPEGAEVVWVKLRLFCPFASNSTNRLYMTAYPLETM